ncbi:Ca-activated chloride channel family protein [Gracilibacillus ureilyticus]|uniref:Ca-activated chloride channel family protein n=2 Tax=Gracilibacillus ureilyticus TaxID=531814 RepID=A0A1H9MXG2_9BACI|nr:Ca-activated chloride channel family protein [Gracilibacillus ureilyticus]
MKKVLIFLVFGLVLLTACSAQQEGGAASNEETNDETEVENEDAESNKEAFSESEFSYYELEEMARPLTELEQELLRKPGKYSGDNYEEEAVKQEIDKLPDDLTAEQYLNELVYLLAEDYHEEIDTIVNFDTEINVEIARPDETVDSPTMKTAHYAILMDASSSMHQEIDGKKKWESAKEAVTSFAEALPGNATVSIRVYGHEGTSESEDKELSCSSTENIYSGGYDADLFEKSLSKIYPSGYTPIALAIESSEEDIPEEAEEVVVYIVSDGIETCDGNPVQAAEQLVEKGIQTVVNIIGFDVDDEGQQLLKEVADAGNGEFTYVDSDRELKKYMREQYEAIQQAWYDWKQEGKSQSYELKEQKKELAYDTKQQMKDKSSREKERLKAAQQYLEDRFDDYHHPSNQVFGLVVDYSNEIWRYAVDSGNKLYRESVDNGNAEYREYVDEGNEKIRETIDKKNSQ